ncbi:haloacid dehalogenase-like hydrolase [Rhodobacteraceae bacterium XHP0102]|nr:haloacid dehalogenase-like hydrolase [Rhodobacteraceae bacterium XHP0102]
MSKPKKLIKAAIIYDFDGTLAKGNMQEPSFIRSMGMTGDDFWKEVKKRTQHEDADETLMYMYLMLELAQKKGERFTKEYLQNHGKDMTLFAGLHNGEWFERINDFARQHGIALEHYIISVGLEEMISGQEIKKNFKKVYASKFLYQPEEQGVAIGPAVGINYTTKTQYLFRINKGIENHYENKKINKYIPEGEREIPFERMIFVGDGDSDIPTMKMLTYKGGTSIAVYDPERTERDLHKIHSLISDSRVDFTAPADYSENSRLDITVKGIVGRMARKSRHHL